MTNLVESFDEVVRIANDATEPVEAWNGLIQYFLATLSADAIDVLHTVSIEEDVRSVRHQLERLLSLEPPRRAFRALYFGLFDATDATGEEQIGYYVTGVENFEDEDSLCAADWCPDGRYLQSQALTALKKAEMAASGEARRFISYVGQIGVALVVTRFASMALVANTRRFVGFDSGDIAEIKP
jgi:hypothetical protein